MRTLKRTAIASAAAQVALLCCGTAMAQTTTEPAPEDTTVAKPAAAGAVKLDTVVVKGQRKALQSAQELKRNAEEIVDSVVAEEAGKLPDKSITEVLQRVVGVTVIRQRNMDNDAAHFSEEGSGIKVRGLPWGSSNMNGREIFSAGWPGKDLSWGAVPTELMAGVDVYKNPSSERIEGAVSGLVDLRTHLPFDFKETKGYVSLGANVTGEQHSASPSASGLYTTQWDSDFGRLGVLFDVAINHSTYTQDTLELGPYYQRELVQKDAQGNNIGAPFTAWTPNGANWGSSSGTTDRQGFYGALQWKKNDKESALTYFLSQSKDTDQGSRFYTSMENPYKSNITNPVMDARGVVVSGHYTYPGTDGLPSRDANGNIILGSDGNPIITGTHGYGGGLNNFPFGGIAMGNSRYYNTNDTSTGELAWNFKWKVNDRWAVQSDLQWVNSKFETNGREIQLGTYMPSIDITTNGNSPVQLGFDQATRDFLANPNNYFWGIIQPKLYKGESNLYAGKIDAKFNFDDAVLRDFRFGWRASQRDSVREEASFASDKGGTGWKTMAAGWDQVGANSATSWPQNVAKNGNWGYIGAPNSNGNYNYPTELFNYSNLVGGRMGNLPNVVYPTFDFIKNLNNYGPMVNNVYYQRCVDKNGVGTKGSTCGFQPGSADYKAALAGTYYNNPTNDPAIAAQNAALQKLEKEKYAFDPTLLYGQDPSHTSNAQLTTHAMYGNLRFGFEDWKVPVDGNVGLRAVYTKVVSHGHIGFDIPADKYANVQPSVPHFNNIPGGTPLDVSDDHIDFMPSLNLKANFTNKLQGRIALARSIYQPDFKQLQENIGLKQDISNTGDVSYSGSNSGNSKLRPLKADSFDISLEWYPKSGQSLTAVAFYKDVKDIIYDSTYTRTYNSSAGTPQTFLITGPANMAEAKLHGIELSADSYLDHFDFLQDKLPTWSKGVGVSANYTYIAHDQTFYRDGGFTYCPASEAKNSAMQIYGCDLNGLPFKEKLPMKGVAKNAANFALHYDLGGFSGRLAYNWNSRTLTGLSKGGGNNGNSCGEGNWCPSGVSADPANAGVKTTWWALPVYQEAYGQWDLGGNYEVNKKFSVSFSVSNIANVVVRETVEQAPGVMGHVWRYPGQNYNLSARYEF